MVRVPWGLMVEGGALPATGHAPARPPRTPQRHYWRHTSTPLFAGATGTLFTLKQFPPSGDPIGQTATTGPTAAGERWVVDLIQVTIPAPPAANTINQSLIPPQVTQQLASQAQNAISPQPPPVVAQAWLSAGGTNLHLLAQTTQGNYDTLDAGGQVLTPGEAITVLWWANTTTGFSGIGYMALRGTRHALSVI